MIIKKKSIIKIEVGDEVFICQILSYKVHYIIVISPTPLMYFLDFILFPFLYFDGLG